MAKKATIGPDTMVHLSFKQIAGSLATLIAALLFGVWLIMDHTYGSLVGRISDVNTNVNGIRADLGGLRQDNKAMRGAISGNRTDLVERIHRTDTNVTKLVASVQLIASETKGTKEGLADLKKSVDGLADRLKASTADPGSSPRPRSSSTPRDGNGVQAPTVCWARQEDYTDDEEWCAGRCSGPPRRLPLSIVRGGPMSNQGKSAISCAAEAAVRKVLIHRL